VDDAIRNLLKHGTPAWNPSPCGFYTSSVHTHSIQYVMKLG